MGLRLSLKKKSKKSKGAAAEGKTTKKVSKKKSKETATTRTRTTKEEEESKSNTNRSQSQVNSELSTPSSSSSSCLMMIQDTTITNPIAHEASIEVRSFGVSDLSLTEITLEEESLVQDSEEVYATKELLDDPNINMDDSSQHRQRRRDDFVHEEDSSIDLVARPLLLDDEDKQTTHHKDLEEWNQIKQPLEEIVLQTEFECSDGLNAFVDHFLNDNAPYSIEKYQRDIIGDKDIEYSKWKSGTTNIQSRSINFIHPLKNKVGPSQAKTSRQQQLSTFGNYYGLCLQNTTRVQGVPGADCFRGEDKWILEHDIAKGRIQMTVSYRLVFEKRCMVQKIIQKNYRKETKDWYENYAKFIKESLMKVETASRSQQEQQQQQKLEEKNLLQQQVNHHHPMQQMIQKVNSSSDDTAATIQSSCTGSFDSPTSSSNSGADDAEEKDQQKIASLTSQVDDLKAINESQAKRIDELEQQLRLSLQSQQSQSQQQEKKLFTGHYIKQLQQHQQQQDKKLFTGHYLKQLQSTLDEHGRAVQ